MDSLKGKITVIHVFGCVSLTLWIYWFIIIFYRLHQTIKKRRICTRSQELEPQVRKQNLYNLETARNKDSFLLVILFLETIITINTGFVFPKLFYSEYNNEPEKTTNSTFSCEINTFLTFNYTYPVAFIFYVSFCMLYITQMLVIAYLNLYIVARYFKHKVTRETRLKLMYWWIIQWFVLAITSIRQLQLFLYSAITILLAVNLVVLNYSRKKLCNVIQSKIDEIRNFEWNPTQLRNLTVNLRFYNLTMKIIIIVFFLTFLGMFLISICFISEMILTGNCFLKKVYDIDINLFSENKTRKIYLKFEDVINWSAVVYCAIIMSTLMAPSIIFILIYLANYMYDKCTGKGHTYKLQKALLEPMLQNEYD